MTHQHPSTWRGEVLRWYLTRARHPFKDYIVGHYWALFCRPRVWVPYDGASVISVSLGDYLQQRIFDPLGMVDTSFHVAAAKRDRFAALYRQGPAGGPLRTRDDGSADARYAEGGTYFSGAGGLTSTAADYMRFAKMLANGGELDGERIIGTRTVEYMAANHLPDGAEFADIVNNPLSTWITKGTGFGLGFAVLMDPVKAGVLGTEGEYYWNGAFSTSFFVSPGEDLVAMLLTQLGNATYDIRREWRSTVYQAITD